MIRFLGGNYSVCEMCQSHCVILPVIIYLAVDVLGGAKVCPMLVSDS
jgi:hypothetical protein